MSPSPDFRSLPIDHIEPSGLNPRTHWDDQDDADLVASIKVEGVIEPIIVRPHPASPAVYQIVAGERRTRAARAAGLTEMPAVVREVSDEKLLDLALAENIQRRTMHPLDVANGFQRRIEMGGTIESLADTLGLTPKYVRDLARFKDLIPDVIAELEAKELTVGHGVVLSKHTPEMQKRALSECQEWQFDFKKGEQVRVYKSVTDFKVWLAEEVRLDLKSKLAQEEFPEMLADVAKYEATGATVLAISENWQRPYHKEAEANEPLYRSRWEECKKNAKGAQKAVIVEGRRQGKALWVTVKAEPPKPVSSGNNGSSSTSQKKKSTAADKAAAAKRKAEEEKQARARARAHAVTARCTAMAVAKTKAIGGKSLLGLLVLNLAGASSFDAEAENTLCTELKLPKGALSYRPSQKLLSNLTDKQLIAAIVAHLANGVGGNRADVFKTFGISYAKVDAAVEKELAAKAEPTDKKPAKKAKAKK